MERLAEELEKPEWIEKTSLAEIKTVRNNGQVMSVVALREDSDDEIDTTGNFENNCIWTAYYTVAECYRYKVTGDLTARTNAYASMRTLLQLEEIPRKPGLIARGFKRQLRETWDEAYFWRGRSGRDADGQPKSEWHADLTNDIRFLTDPSKGQLEGWLFGLCEYYDFLADENEKEEIRDAVSRMVGAYLKNNFSIIDLNGEPTQYGSHTQGGLLLPGNKLRLLGLLKRAAHITREERFQKAYDAFAKEKGWLGKCASMFHSRVRSIQEWIEQKRFHNSDHLEMIALEALLKYETDHELKKILQTLEYDAHDYSRQRHLLPFKNPQLDEGDVTLLRRMTVNKVIHHVIAPKPVREKSLGMDGRMRLDYRFADEFEWRRNPRFGVGYNHPQKLHGYMFMPAVDFLYAYWKTRWRQSPL